MAPPHLRSDVSWNLKKPGTEVVVRDLSGRIPRSMHYIEGKNGKLVGKKERTNPKKEKQTNHDELCVTVLAAFL